MVRTENLNGHRGRAALLLSPESNKPSPHSLPACRCPSPLPLPGQGSDRPGRIQGSAGSRPQLLTSQSEVQRQPGRQHDHPVDRAAGSAGQGHQHVLHACSVGTLLLVAVGELCKKKWFSWGHQGSPEFPAFLIGSAALCMSIIVRHVLHGSATGFPSNRLLLRVRSEWYGYHFPELIKIVPDNSMYCRVARLIGNRKELSEESLEGLEEVVMDSAKAQAILEASRSSMGQWTATRTGLFFVVCGFLVASPLFCSPRTDPCPR